MTYLIQRAKTPPEHATDWDSPAWRDVTPLRVDQFHPQSSDHRPVTQAKLLYTDEALSVIFRVQDQYVQSVRTEFQEMVCRDSCVEIFLQPSPTHGYFNFEFNCGGAMLAYYIEDPTPTESGLKRFQPLSRQQGSLVHINTTMPSTTPVEITDPIEWRLEASIPFAVFHQYIPNLNLIGWRGNLYKCASENSKPHWASWMNLGERLSFHQPAKFGELIFTSSACRL